MLQNLVLWILSEKQNGVPGMIWVILRRFVCIIIFLILYVMPGDFTCQGMSAASR